MASLQLLPFLAGTSLSVQRYWIKARIQAQRDLRNFYRDEEDLVGDLTKQGFSESDARSAAALWTRLDSEFDLESEAARLSAGLLAPEDGGTRVVSLPFPDGVGSPRTGDAENVRHGASDPRIREACIFPSASSEQRSSLAVSLPLPLSVGSPRAENANEFSGGAPIIRGGRRGTMVQRDPCSTLPQNKYRQRAGRRATLQKASARRTRTSTRTS